MVTAPLFLRVDIKLASKFLPLRDEFQVKAFC